jgi:hypothetical protein
MGLLKDRREAVNLIEEQSKVPRFLIRQLK